jgi:hypothetical protein
MPVDLTDEGATCFATLLAIRAFSYTSSVMALEGGNQHQHQF